MRRNQQSFFEMMPYYFSKSVGKHLTKLVKKELSEFLGREQCERKGGDKNHRKIAYKRSYTLKGIGEVSVKIPRERKGEYQTNFIPKSKQTEEALVDDLSLMLLTNISTLILYLISKILLGKSISPSKISSANK